MKAFGTCVDNKGNGNAVMEGGLIPNKEADPFAIDVLGVLVRLESLKAKGPIDFTVTPMDHCQTQKYPEGQNYC